MNEPQIRDSENYLTLIILSKFRRFLQVYKFYELKRPNSSSLSENP